MKTYRVILAGYDDNGDLCGGGNPMPEIAESFMPPRAGTFLEESHDQTEPLYIVFSYLRVEANDWKGAAEKVARMYFATFDPANDMPILSLPKYWVERDPSGKAEWDIVPDIAFPVDADGDCDADLVIPEGHVPENYRIVTAADLPMEVMEISDSAYLDYDYLDSLHVPTEVLLLGPAAESYMAVFSKCWKEFDREIFGKMFYLLTGDPLDMELEHMNQLIIHSRIEEFSDEDRATFDDHRRQIEKGWKWRMTYHGYGG